MRRLLRSSKLLWPVGKLLGKTSAFLAPLALKLGVTRRVLLTLIGVAVAIIVVLVLLVMGLLGSFG